MTARGVIFDCDGVLVDSEMLAARAMSAVLERAGVVFSAPDIVRHCVGLSQKDILATIAARSGTPVPLAAADQLWPETRALFAAELQAMPGIDAVLQSLSVPFGVASSSSPERIAFCLERTGLARHFGASVFSSSMVARGKPAPDLFLFAAERLGVAPAACVVVEDSVAGTQGALAAGMTVLGFAGGSHAGAVTIERLHAAGAGQVVTDWVAGGEALRRLLPQSAEASPEG